MTTTVATEPNPSSRMGLNCFGYKAKGRPREPKRRERKHNSVSEHTHLI